jgi:hypothetical protein
MVRFRKISPDLALDKSANQSDEEAQSNKNSLPAGFVRPLGPQNYFGGIHAVVSELINSWRRRRSKRS